MSERVDDVISCSKCLKSCTGNLCAKFGCVWVKGGKVMMGADQMGSEGVFKVPV